MPGTTVLIDSSYYNFYRFCATVGWYNYSPERKAAAENKCWLDNPTFMATFEKMWFENIYKITKKFKVTESDLVFARDGSNVWRYAVYPEYKQHRSEPADTDDDPHSPGPVFKHINEHYHRRVCKKGAQVVRVDTAEADDIVAVAVDYILTIDPERKIFIITGDHDFLQLSKPGQVELYQLKGWKQITSADPHAALMMKILAGDPSDHIPPIYKGCGKKSAEKLIRDPQLLEQALEKYGSDQYELNCLLVDFKRLPTQVVEEIEALLDDAIKL